MNPSSDMEAIKFKEQWNTPKIGRLLFTEKQSIWEKIFVENDEKKVVWVPWHSSEDAIKNFQIRFVCLIKANVGIVSACHYFWRFPYKIRVISGYLYLPVLDIHFHVCVCVCVCVCVYCTYHSAVEYMRGQVLCGYDCCCIKSFCC